MRRPVGNDKRKRAKAAAHRVRQPEPCGVDDGSRDQGHRQPSSHRNPTVVIRAEAVRWPASPENMPQAAKDQPTSTSTAPSEGRGDRSGRCREHPQTERASGDQQQARTRRRLADGSQPLHDRSRLTGAETGDADGPSGVTASPERSINPSYPPVSVQTLSPFPEQTRVEGCADSIGGRRAQTYGPQTRRADDPLGHVKARHSGRDDMTQSDLRPMRAAWPATRPSARLRWRQASAAARGTPGGIRPVRGPEDLIVPADGPSPRPTSLRHRGFSGPPSPPF